MAQNQEQLKFCFVICPIGDPGSDHRKWSDDVFENLLKPIADEFRYYTRRAIDDSRPGEITSNIIDDIVRADLVIADLTFHNANVFYELALRHSHGGPFFHIAASGTKIPFDISTINTVFVDCQSFAAADKTRNDLRAHFGAIDTGTASFENPVKRHQQKLKADQTGDPLASRVVALEEEISLLRKGSNGSRQIFTPTVSSRLFENVNVRILAELDTQITQTLLNGHFKLIFNPTTQASKPITFLANGSIGEGRNRNEAGWRVIDGRLEILNPNNEVYSRFIFAKETRSFHHTNEPDTKSIKGQLIVPE